MRMCSFHQSDDIELNLLEKTEIWIEGIRLKNADLREVAAAVAKALGLRREEVVVIDVRENLLVLDILRNTIKASNIIGKEKVILAELRKVPGVEVNENASIHSEGILSLIALDEALATKLLEEMKLMQKEIVRNIQKRVLVFSTGFEVKQGIVKDTNYEVISSILSKLGFIVRYGGVLEDDEDIIAGALRKAIDEGYGFIITTGGTGAEEKDKTIEALLKVDKDAATPCVVRYEKGKGRHVKDCVRVGVGRVGITWIIALPGPTDEVEKAMEVLVDVLNKGLNLDKESLAKAIAYKLQITILEKMKNHDKHHFK
mgnify:CR=1 FL=1